MTNPGKQPSVADVMTIPRQQECAADDMTLQCKRRFPGPHRGGPLRVASALRGGRTVGLVHTVCSVADGQSGWFIQFAPWRTDSRVGSYSLLRGGRTVGLVLTVCSSAPTERGRYTIAQTALIAGSMLLVLPASRYGRATLLRSQFDSLSLRGRGLG
jgi:hypothetical protein